LLLVAFLGNPSSARADETTARELFEEGTLALREGRLPEARDLLRRSLEHHAHPATAFNLAVTLRGLGSPTEALPVCQALLDGRYGELDESRRAQAEEICAEARREVAVLEIRATGAQRIEIRIDGEPTADVAEGEALRRDVNAGRHVVQARADGLRGDERVVRIEPGGRAEISLRLVAEAEDGEGSGLALGWWIAGGVALAVIATVVTVVLLSSSADPVGGDFPITATLVGPR